MNDNESSTGTGNSVCFNFTDHRCVVTGGAQGIGLAVVKEFLAAGGQASIWDLDMEALAAAKSELSPLGDRVSFRTVDIGNAESIQAAAAQEGDLDLLVNCAGITKDKTAAKMPLGDFEAVVRVNLTGTFAVTQALLPKFRKDAPKGRSPHSIVNLSSVVASYGNFGQANYVAAKAGVEGLTKTLARELGPKGFRVNAVAPGFTATRMVAAMPEDRLRVLAERVPLGRLGEPTDIAAVCLFLASDAAAYMNGSVVSVDGGLVC